VAVCVVPKLDGIRKIVRPPHSHRGTEEQNRNGVKSRLGIHILAGSKNPGKPCFFAS
jgi:hypothetical protein